jgi:phenylacetate-CoA ligase
VSAAPSFANTANALPPATGDGLPAPLAEEICKIHRLAPVYAQRRPLPARPLNRDDYAAIPALSKREIVERGHQSFFPDYTLVERGLAASDYEYESTSGTTQGPMTVIMERGWWDAQTRRAYLAHPLLAPFADTPHRKCILAPVGCSSNLCPYEDHPFPNRYNNGTVYLNLTSDPFMFPDAEWSRILTELQAVKPDIIEGEPIYLSLLARAAAKRKITLPSLRLVILTYGKASLQHSQRVSQVFNVPQVDLYGSTEAGYLFVGTAFKDDSRVIDANAFVELVPYRDLADVYQIHVTTRDRLAMPLLRYHTGDIIKKFPTGYRLLGREDGLHFRADGSLLTSADVDAVIPENFLCWHYVLQQTSPARWDFHYVAEANAPDKLPRQLAEIIGDNARVSPFRHRAIPPAPSGKFALLKPLRK